MSDLDLDPDESPPDDLASFADAVARMCDGHVLIFDRLRHLVAYSTFGPVDELRREAILSRRTPDWYQEQLDIEGGMGRLMSGEVTRYKGSFREGGRYRFGAAVKVGAEHLGFITVLPHEPVDEERLAAAVGRARDAAVPRLIGHLAWHAGHARRSEQVRPLLFGGEGMGEAAAALGLARAPATTVVAMQPLPGATVSPLRVLSVLEVHASGMGLTAVTAIFGQVVYLALGGPADAVTAMAARAAHAVIAELNPSRDAFIAGVGAPVERPGLIPDSRDQAELVLEVVRGAPAHGPVGVLEELRGAVMLEHVRRSLASRSWLLEGPVARLRRQDQAVGGDLVRTLRAWLEHGQSGRAAARALGMHSSTFHNRLARVQSVGGLDLGDHEAVLAAHIELNLG